MNTSIMSQLGQMVQMGQDVVKMARQAVSAKLTCTVTAQLLRIIAVHAAKAVISMSRHDSQTCRSREWAKMPDSSGIASEVSYLWSNLRQSQMYSLAAGCEIGASFSLTKTKHRTPHNCPVLQARLASSATSLRLRTLT